MIAVAVVVLLFVALALAAMRWGADTREAREWQPGPTPAADWSCGAPRCP